jgi:long-chain acyl-CoA synthetase
MTSLANNLLRSAGEHPDRVAVRLDDTALTYAQVDALTARVAGRLQELGLVPGDRVGLMLPNVLAFPILYYGVLRAGGVVVPMNPLLKAREVKHYLGDSGANLAFAWEDFADEAVIGAADLDAAVVTVTGQSLSDMPAGRAPKKPPNGHPRTPR